MPLVVLVTGCTTGSIGYSLSEEFARQGCTVYATSRNVETVAESTFSNVKRLALDVTDDLSVQHAIEHVIHEDGKLDILVNNAGGMSAGALLDFSSEDVQKAFNLNTFSILRVSKAVVPHMAARGTGLIVNIGSVVGEIPTPWGGLYCANKAAVHSISQVLAMECQPLNIQVIHVAPGAVTSNFSRNGTGSFSVPEGSLWSAYLPDMIRRINASQGAHSLPTEVFAQKVVSRALGKSRPFYDYMTLGGQSTLFAILKWLPRIMVLRQMWKTYSKKA